MVRVDRTDQVGDGEQQGDDCAAGACGLAEVVAGGDGEGEKEDEEAKEAGGETGSVGGSVLAEYN